MSKPSTALSLILPEAKPAQLEDILLALRERENVHLRLGLLCQAAQGAILYKLQIEYGFTRGGDRKSVEAIKTAPCGFDSWTELVEKKFGFSDDKARRLMGVCDGFAQKVKDLSPKERERMHEFLCRPLLHLSEPEVKVLEKITHKITDAETQKEFLLECGFLKKPRAGLRNGGPSGAGTPRDESELIQEDFYSVLDELTTFAESTIKRGKDDISKLALIPKDRWLTHRADLKQLIAKGDALHGIKEEK